MARGAYLPCCAFGLKDCFAYSGFMGTGECAILTSPPTGRKCPFYKTNKQIGQEQTRTVKRLTRYGRTDLLEEYGEIEVNPKNRKEVKR
ncbi:MAG: hypothetical protein NC401_18860 [Ruminococcus sp.]|nr:hypothetical protein [Ruminococcus sp.]